MGKSRFIILCFILIVAVFLATFTSKGYCSRPLKDESTRHPTVSEETFDVSVSVFLAGKYDFFDSSIPNEVMVNVSVQLSEPPATPWEISVFLSFSLTEVTDLPTGTNYTYGFWGLPPTGALKIYVPANMGHFSFKLRGQTDGSSFFWRNTAEIFFLNVTSSSIARVPSYELIVVPPSPCRVLRVYSYLYPDLRYQEVNVGAQKSIIIVGGHPFSPIVVLYEAENRENYALMLMFILIFVFIALPYITVKFKKFSVVIVGVTKTFRQSFLKLMNILGRLYKEISKLNSSSLLSMFISVGLLMASLSFIAGPDPRLKVYVLASTPGTARTLGGSIEREGDMVAITVYDEMNEIDNLANFGVFSTVVVGDFFPPSETMLKTRIYPALDAVPSIIIVKSYAIEIFSSEIKRRYSEKTTFVEDVDTLISLLHEIPRRQNALGLRVGVTTYKIISAFVGFCSLIIAFFGLAFLTSKLIEVGRKPRVSGVPEAITYTIFAFFFTLMIYIVCSVLLAMPLGLHAAATSSSKVTAVGFFGFGGGTKPRMVAGLAGFLFGVFISLRKGPFKLDKIALLLFLIIGFFILLDPLTGGVIFYEFVLLFTVGPGLENAYMAWSYVRAFLGTIAIAFSAWITPNYEISTGIMLYFVGAIPFCLFSKMKKWTSTLMLLFSAFCASSGYIRVADMKPLKTVASIIPGIMAGFIFLAIFCLINLIETVLREKLWR